MASKEECLRIAENPAAAILFVTMITSCVMILGFAIISYCFGGGRRVAHKVHDMDHVVDKKEEEGDGEKIKLLKGIERGRFIN